MRKILLALILVLCPYIFSQTTTYDNPNIFGDYHLVTESTVPSYNIQYNTTTYDSQLSGPRKAQKSGSGSATSDDGTVTITYTWTWSGIFTYTITYSDGTSETITCYQWLGESITDKTYEAAKKEANRLDEEKRLATPIGNSSILLLFCGIYVILRWEGLGNKV